MKHLDHTRVTYIADVKELKKRGAGVGLYCYPISPISYQIVRITKEPDGYLLYGGLKLKKLGTLDIYFHKLTNDGLASVCSSIKTKACRAG